LLIHAAKGFPLSARQTFYEPIFRHPLYEAGYTTDTLPRGVLVATAELVDVIKITSENRPDLPEWAFGDYHPGRFAWHLENVKKFSVLIPWRGQLGVFNVDGPLI